MADKVDIGSKIPDYGNLSIGRPEEKTVEETKGAGVMDKDTLGVSITAAGKREVIESDRPNIAAPDEEKVNGLNLQQSIHEIKTNPWLSSPSFLAKFNIVMDKLLNLQRKTRMMEAKAELNSRQRIYESQKSVAQLAKDLMNNQAQEQYTQAVSSFANAGVSLGQFGGTLVSLKAAKVTVENEKKAQVAEIKRLKTIDDAHTVGAADTSAQVQALRAIPKPSAADIKAAEDRLKEIESPTYQQNVERNYDLRIQYMGEANKKAIDGTAAMYTATIKEDSGVKEKMQKMEEGFIQAMNKHSETISKARDDAAANFTRFVDFLSKIIESDFRAHNISGRS